MITFKTMKTSVWHMSSRPLFYFHTGPDVIPEHVMGERGDQFCMAMMGWVVANCSLDNVSDRPASNPRQAGLFSAITLARCCLALSQGEHLEPIWPLVPYTHPMYG